MKWSENYKIKIQMMTMMMKMPFSEKRAEKATPVVNTL